MLALLGVLIFLFAASHGTETLLYTGVERCTTQTTTIIIGASVKEIPNRAFGPPKKLTALQKRMKEFPCKNVHTVDFSAAIALTSIGDYAFQFTAIEHVTFPPQLKTIGHGAFMGITALTTLDFSLASSLVSIGNVYPVLDDHSEDEEAQRGVSKSVQEGSFMECGNLTSVVLPESLVSLGDAAFLSCHALTEVMLPDSLRVIGTGAFIECSALERIVLPAGLTSLGMGAFSKCSNLRSISGGELAAGGLDGDGDDGEAEDGVLPLALRKIGDGTFNGCEKLEAIVLPDSVKSIGFAAFQKNTALRSMVLPRSLHTVKAGAFDGCVNLWVNQSLVLPPKLASIGRLAFQGVSLDSNFLLTFLSSHSFVYSLSHPTLSLALSLARSLARSRALSRSLSRSRSLALALALAL